MHVVSAPPLGFRIGEGPPVIDRELRLDVAGGYGVHANVRGGIFDAGRARAPDEAVLGDGIGKASGDDRKPVTRSDIDDRAAARGDHRWERRLADAPDPVEVHSEAAPPFLLAGRQRLVENIDAGLVDEDFDAIVVRGGRGGAATDRMFSHNSRLTY